MAHALVVFLAFAFLTTGYLEIHFGFTSLSRLLLELDVLTIFSPPDVAEISERPDRDFGLRFQIPMQFFFGTKRAEALLGHIERTSQLTVKGKLHLPPTVPVVRYLDDFESPAHTVTYRTSGLGRRGKGQTGEKGSLLTRFSMDFLRRLMAINSISLIRINQEPNTSW